MILTQRRKGAEMELEAPQARRGWSAVCPKPQRVAGDSD